MAEHERAEPPVPKKPESIRTPAKNDPGPFRTPVNYRKAYILPYEYALRDTYSTLSSDIERMKVQKPVPESALADARDELVQLKKQMSAAGIKLYD